MSWRPESPPSSQSMYRGLYKSRSVKPKGTYKRSRARRGNKLPRPQEFAGQLQGAMRLKPNGKTQHRFKFEGFTPIMDTTLTASKSANFISFSLGLLPNSGEIVSMFQRYKITGVTCMVYLEDSGTTTSPTVVLLAPYKCNTVATVNANSVQMVQGCQWKPLVSSQDLLRCRILNPVPFVAASVGGEAPAAVFAGQGTIFCTTSGSAVPHAGFLVARDGDLPTGAKVSYKLNIQFECFDFKISPTLATVSDKEKEDKDKAIVIRPKTLSELGLV